MVNPCDTLPQAAPAATGIMPRPTVACATPDNEPDSLPMQSAAFSASRQNLTRLVMIRALIALLQLVALLFAKANLQLALPYAPLLLTLVITIAATLHATYLLRDRREPSDGGFFLQLLADIAQLTLFLYFAGGATNPFVSYYLVPLCISAAVLPARFTWFTAAVTLLAYSVLLFQYHPVALLEMNPHAHHHDQGNTINPHILGMWINFLLSAVLIANFVASMASTLRRQQAALAEARETALQQDQLIAVATLAAGTAHELGTPLATMTMLVEELQAGGDRAQQQQDLQMLQTQLQRCRSILQKLSTTAEFGASTSTTAVAFDSFMRSTLEHWQVTHPSQPLKIDWQDAATSAAPAVLADTIVQQALVNLLNNGARAARGAVQVTLRWNDNGGTVQIRDDGPGIPPEVIAQLGQPLATSQGLGIGLFLSHAAIRQHGGTLALQNLPDGGAQAHVFLPAVAAVTHP